MITIKMTVWFYSIVNWKYATYSQSALPVMFVPIWHDSGLLLLPDMQLSYQLR